MSSLPLPDINWKCKFNSCFPDLLWEIIPVHNFRSFRNAFVRHKAASATSLVSISSSRKWRPIAGFARFKSISMQILIRAMKTDSLPFQRFNGVELR